MSEVFWPTPTSPIDVTTTTWLAQTFAPHYSHVGAYIRLKLSRHFANALPRISIQYLKPDGTPDGVWLSTRLIGNESFGLGDAITTIQLPIPTFRAVATIEYALVIQLEGTPPVGLMRAFRQLPPSDYPRGKLIRSLDSGATWDTTDLGDLAFGEWGDPPLFQNPHSPPIQHYAILECSQNDYYTNACIRVSTSEPCTLVCYVTDDEPQPIESYRTTRGVSTLCLDHYTFKNYRSYNQKESYDSLYHTFYIGGLKEGQKYWFCFWGQTDFTDANSTGPIFNRTHPEAPPFTTIRRPTSPGIQCHIRHEIGDPCPNHYLNLDEAISDEHATYIWPFSGASNWQLDLYGIDDLSPGDTAPIHEVHLTARVRRIGGYAYASRAKFCVLASGVKRYSPNYTGISEGWTNIHWHLHLNPSTNLPWTMDEINALQIGLELGTYWGVGWATVTQATQLYCRIIHACDAYW